MEHGRRADDSSDCPPGARLIYARPTRMKKPLLIAFGAILVVIVCGCCIWVGILAQRDQDNYAALSAACDGRGVPGSATYAPGGTNKIVYFERIGSLWSESNLAVPDALRGAGTSDTALVACAADDTTQHEIEQCCFEQTVVGIGVPGTNRCLPRAQLARHVELRIASTGALLASREVLGPLPKPCSEVSGGRRPTATQFEGREPDVDQFAPFYRDPTAPDPAATPPAVPAAPPTK
jgi:hypothetical protein